MTLTMGLSVLALTGCVLWTMWFSIHELRPKHAGCIPTVWYIFSFAVCVTFVVAYWANHAGAFDANGNVHGTAGKFILSLLPYLLNLNDDMKAVCALLFLIAVPQFLSYVFSALFGCATKPILIAGAITFVTWLLAKSFATASGVLVAIVVFGYFRGWLGFEAADCAKLILLASWLVPLSFVMLYFHYEAFDLVAMLPKRCVRLRALLERVHRWATRHSQVHAMTVTPGSTSASQPGQSI